MSTTTAPAQMTGNPVVNSTRAELLRLRKWPAVWFTIGGWLVMNALFSYVFNYVSYTSGEQFTERQETNQADLLASLLPTGLPENIVQTTPMFGGAIMMVLGAIIAGNGYGWGTWKTVLTQGPSRTSTLTGSLSASSVVAATVVLGMVVTDVVLSYTVVLLESESAALPDLSDTVAAIGAAFLVMEMWTLVGYFLGTLARSPGLSVGLGLVWTLVVENLLRGVGASLSWVESFAHVLPGTAAGSLIGQMVGVGDEVDQAPGLLDTLSQDRALATTVAYVVLLPVITWWLMRRRDVA